MPTPQSQKIEYMADGFRINGPRIDGSWTVTYTLGEYEASKLKPHFDIPSQTVLKITVEAGE
jgi:hypothetical protein